MFGLWATLWHSFKARYYAPPPIIGCADMPRGAVVPRLPLRDGATRIHEWDCPSKTMNVKLSRCFFRNARKNIRTQ